MSSMAASVTLLFALFISIISSSSSSFPPVNFANNNTSGFKTYLIHRDSPHSPLYNPNATLFDRIKAAKTRSFDSRHRHRHRGYFSSPDDMTAPLSSEYGEYLIKYLIGTPPVVTYGIADTGSDLIWLQCLPCDKCFKQAIPIFDSRASSSYKVIDCDAPQCNQVQVGTQCEDDKCSYAITYVDGASSLGYLSAETFIFGDSQSGNRSLNAFIFGCGHFNTETVDAVKPPGIVGLNQGSLSLIKQFSFDNFSYCFVPKFNTPSNSPIHFGSPTVADGARTPMAYYGLPNYYLDLEQISVGNVSTPIPPGTFDVTKNGIGGFVIDSGTTFTQIESGVFEAMIHEVARQIDYNTVEDPSALFDLCYGVEIPALEEKAPAITFHFADGADLVFKGINAWIQVQQGLTCLAMFGVFGGTSILGNHQQQNVHVVYNLKERYISFKPTDCTKVV